jgi:hypothetical protein
MKQLLLLEIILIGAVFTLLFFVIDTKSIIITAESILSRLEKRPLTCVFGIIVIAVVSRVLCLSFFPPPQPTIADEFSYLLAADTFTLGRLSNPTHPYWQFFESFHINQIPTYASMYPPAQGLVLAAGQIVTDSPWLGVLISTAVMCGILCWMLHGWLPFRWALIGGLFAVVRISLFSYWGNSYWGGSVAAIGGLLILGAIPRIINKNSSVLTFFMLALGILILANTRPYEGLVLCLAAVLAGFTTYLNSRRLIKKLLTIKWLVVLFTLLIGLAAMGIYNRRVTGAVFVMPYQVNQQQYAMAKPFLWQTPSANVEYRHKVMKDLYTEYYLMATRARSSISSFVDLAVEKLATTWLFFIGPVLSVPLVGLSKAIFDRRIRFLVLTGIFAVPGILAETWFHAHYAAPFIGIIYVVVLQSMRHICFSRKLAVRTRHAFFLTVPTVTIAMTLIVIITFPPRLQGRDFGTWCCNPNGPSARSVFVNQLKAKGGRHLVFVEYTSAHNLHEEWVYNGADIDNSPIVFARHMDSIKDSQLIRYFSGRQVWRLIVGDGHLTLERYE